MRCARLRRTDENIEKGGAARSSYLSAWRYVNLPRMDYFTATTVRVDTFVYGARNSEEFAEGEHADQARSA